MCQLPAVNDDVGRRLGSDDFRSSNRQSCSVYMYYINTGTSGVWIQMLPSSDVRTGSQSVPLDGAPRPRTRRTGNLEEGFFVTNLGNPTAKQTTSGMIHTRGT